MSVADILYGNIVRDIYENGWSNEGKSVRTVWEDGTPAYTKSILNVQMKFDNSTDKMEAILTQKRVPQKDPINELLWIWQKMSNRVKYLQDMGCNVWDEWELEDGTIGKAYGWQLANKYRKLEYENTLSEMIERGELSGNWKHTHEDGKLYVMLNQVDWLIYKLKTDPYSRRLKTTLWCVEDLDDMALEPCVYETHWQVWNDTLNLTVNIRSNDIALGNPYNTFQYSVLHRLIAQVTGHKAGSICFNIDNAHIYDRHLKTVLEQVNEEPMYDAPTIWINPEVKSFYDFTIDDIKLIDYKHGKSRKMEVAI